jgi:hypothetical protein
LKKLLDTEWSNQWIEIFQDKLFEGFKFQLDSKTKEKKMKRF